MTPSELAEIWYVGSFLNFICCMALWLWPIKHLKFCLICTDTIAIQVLTSPWSMHAGMRWAFI